MGYIYILTNPSFSDYVKIGYADDVEKRVRQLNRTECTPFAFRIYATYEVDGRLKDLPMHNIIDMQNPSLRSSEEVNGKMRVREFYAMPEERALSILREVARINGLEDRIKVYDKTKDDIEEEEQAEAIRELNINRHHFKEIEFASSLTGKKYHGYTNESGTLAISEKETGIILKNNDKPSKKAIVAQALEDAGGNSDNLTLYQCYRELSKLISK